MGLIPGWGWTPIEGMVTHSSILAWRIPWREEPDGLHSIELQRVRHNWSNLSTHCMHPKIYHFGISIILSWKQMRINKYIMKPSQSFLYFTKSRNFWEIRTAINPLSWGRLMLMKRMESQCLLTWTCTNKPYFSSLPHSLPLLEVQNPSSFVLSSHYKCIALC